MQKNLFHKAKRKTNQYAREKQAKETFYAYQICTINTAIID